MQRVLVYSHDDQPLFELSPLEVYGLDRKEAVNGEHSLTIRTTRVLEKGQRILTLDNRNRWREHVVYGTDESHESGNKPIGEYYCVWSLMHDLMGTTVSRMPGVQTPVMAGVALDAALSGTARWVAGTVTNSNLGGASMYDMGGWEAMQVMTKTWGGEVDVTIEVGLAGVVSRKVDYYDAQGEHVAKRRFDFGADLKGVRRKIPDGPIFCRISPRGKGEETEGGGYGRKITIESVNDGKDWLENTDLAQLVRLPDGNGGWEYPTRIVDNPQIETPSELKEWGLAVLDDYTVPKVSYDVDAIQAAIEGVDIQGVSLGDRVHVVDAKFGGLRLSARVVSIETDMLDEMAVKVKLGYVSENVGSMLTKLQGDIASVSAAVEAVRNGTEMTDTYLQRLVARLNEEINATGGYWYLIEGQGTRTYDRAVSDPAVGAEATKVIEMKGGSLRIADSKDAQGEWEWDTVFVSGHVAAQLVTAAHLEAGYIGSPTSGNYWNLDTGEFQMAATSTLGTKTVQQIIEGIDATITEVDIEFAQGTSATQAPTSGWQTQPPAWEADKYIWQRTKTVTADGPSYSDPVMISGKDGTDGTSVTILGSYNTLAELQAAHPTGSDGDAYMVGGDLYIWNGSTWEDVGRIQGPQGPAGQSVTVSSIQYGVSNSASATPSWSTTVPTSIDKGKWLWVKTNYSNNTSAITKSYTGTDGSDGKYVAIRSSTKVDGVTTLVLEEVDPETGTSTTRTLTINDGSDGPTGQQGPAGANGASTYVHVAWANSADGSVDFSTYVSEGKSYLGVCTTDEEDDPQTWASYSWSKIEGDKGDNGVGVTGVTEQYYLSKMSGAPTGGTWQTSPPAYKTGHFYFTRTITTYSDGHVVIQDPPVLSRGLNSANKTAADAQAAADANTARLDDENLLLNSSPMEAWNQHDSSAYLCGVIDCVSALVGGEKYTLQVWGSVSRSDKTAVLTAFYGDSSHQIGNLTNDGGVWTFSFTMPSSWTSLTPQIRLYVGPTPYVSTATYTANLTSAKLTKGTYKGSWIPNVADYTTQLGIFNQLTNHGETQGLYMQDGKLYVNANFIRSGYIDADYIQGGTLKLGGQNNAHSINYGNFVLVNASNVPVVRMDFRGLMLVINDTNNDYALVRGGSYGSDKFMQVTTYANNSIRSTAHLHVGGTSGTIGGKITVGQIHRGTSYYSEINTSRSRIIGSLVVGDSVTASSYITSSDRRLKDHIGYIKDKAVDFIRKLKPAIFRFKEKDESTHAGFYAQDVEEADPWGAFVTEEEKDGKPYKMLDYTGLIAPLVAYCQQLERRIEALEKEAK